MQEYPELAVLQNSGRAWKLAILEVHTNYKIRVIVLNVYCNGGKFHLGNDGPTSVEKHVLVL